MSGAGTGAGADGAVVELDAIERLAFFAGIEIEWIDAHGKPARVARPTLVRLLAVMGLEADDDAKAEATLIGLERDELAHALPPVLVHRPAQGELGIPLTLPAGSGDVRWRLECEDGSVSVGSIDFATLPLDEPAARDGIVSRAGVQDDTDAAAGRPMQRRRLTLPVPDLAPGYHRFSLGLDGPVMSLIVTPQRCWSPPALAAGQRLWGIAAQLYLLRSGTDWGIGDFGDLCSLVEIAAGQGADVIGLNPLHSLFIDAPEAASPYSPSSRLLLNPLNIDVMAIPEMGLSLEARALVDSKDFQLELQQCREARLLDYTRVAAIKLSALRLLFDACLRAGDGDRRRAFEAFRRDRGIAFERHCLYLALREHFSALDPARADWHEWPDEYRDPGSAAVARFARDQAHALSFVAWMQWVADQQLAQATALAARRSLAVGLYRDLAIGADRGGAETWAAPGTVVSDAQVGAPPDIHVPTGQDWGLPPFDPRRLREDGYRDFIELVRANMRHAGGLRIDHVMGLARLWWVPRGMTPADGAYVRYPLDDLLGILALESQRQHCLVVGEDLGTVPAGFRERAAAAGVLSYRVLFFEQEEETGEFIAPADYPVQAMAVLGSHDLPTFEGWWKALDLDLKERLGLLPASGEAALQHAMRERDRAALLRALERERLIAPGSETDAPMLARAAHAFIARTPAAVVMVQIDDLAGEVDPVNLPATSDERPNWRRRQTVTLEALAGSRSFAGPVSEMRMARPPRTA